jgi:RND family efflux transporter MFP subunit
MPTTPNRSSYTKLLILGLVILLILGGCIVFISIKKSSNNAKEGQERSAELKEGPVVKTAMSKYSVTPKQLALIGEARPFESSTIYSKISGYLDRILVDKGDKVVQGQLLAEVNNPEIDQLYGSASADLDNKKKILERNKQLLAKNYISQEEVDISQTSVDMAAATLRSYTEQQQYKSIKAPFTGTVTARFADPGALIQNANNSQSSAQPIVTVSQLDKLRIYAYVEQKDAAFIKVGYPVEVGLIENPDLHIKATITRINGALDLRTRMMTAEIDLDNRDQKIIPGSYVQIRITGPLDKNTKIEIPSTALVFHKDKSMVAVVDKDSIVHFRTVKVGENTGEKTTILEGLENGEKVAISVGESIIEGQKVRLDQ